MTAARQRDFESQLVELEQHARLVSDGVDAMKRQRELGTTIEAGGYFVDTLDEMRLDVLALADSITAALQAVDPDGELEAARVESNG